MMRSQILGSLRKVPTGIPKKLASSLKMTEMAVFGINGHDGKYRSEERNCVQFLQPAIFSHF